jgi:hypothetical protein
MKARAPSKEKKLSLSQPGPYSHLTNEELIESLKRLIKKANATKGLSPRSATEILLEDRR